MAAARLRNVSAKRVAGCGLLSVVLAIGLVLFACSWLTVEIHQAALVWDSLLKRLRPGVLRPGRHLVGPSALPIVFDTRVFTLEFLLKVFALGPREYAADRLNLFDGFMVLMFAIETSLLGAGVTTNVFKAMRTFRVVRIFKVLRRIRTFRTLFGKMAKAIRTVMPMSLVLVIVLFMLSILALQLFQDMYSAPYGICDAPEMVEAAASAACSRKPRSNISSSMTANTSR